MDEGAFLHIIGKKIVRIAVDKTLHADYNNRIHRRAILSAKKRPVSFPEAGCFVGYKGEWRICMFIVYFALWVILNGKWTTEIGVFGLVFAAVLYGFSCRFMGYSFKKDLHYLRRLPATLRYGATLLADSAGGYVLVGVASFTAAAVLTVVCMRLHEREKREKNNKTDKEGNAS